MSQPNQYEDREVSNLLEWLILAATKGNGKAVDMHKDAIMQLITQKQLEAKVNMLADGDLMQVGAIPETDEYADGWNDCRKAYFEHRQAIIAELKKGLPQ